MNQDAYRKLISGASGGFGAALLRLFLGAASQAYSTAVALRNFLYSKRWLKTYRVNAPVISVGNITTGGTGKTPLVIWVYSQIIQNFKLQIANCKCAILTRGYKSIQNYTDEPAILAESCPQAEVIINPNRVAGAAEAVDKFEAKVLIMDDGFQHRRLARDLDIVTIDATLPFGYGKMLPAGLLREPIAALKRADAAVITRCDQIDRAQLARLEEKLRQVNPDMIIVRALHAPICARTLDGEEITIEGLKNKKIFGFCGIGNPDAFLSTIEKLGAELVGSKIYNDHHHYSEGDITDIYEQARELKAELILTTQKDRTKIISDCQSSIVFAYLAIELRLPAGEDKLRDLIKDTLAGKIGGK